jgi:hypothetical protein
VFVATDAERWCREASVVMGRSAEVRVGLQAGGLLSWILPAAADEQRSRRGARGPLSIAPVLVRVAVDGEAADAEPGGDPRD